MGMIKAPHCEKCNKEFNPFNSNGSKLCPECRKPFENAKVGDKVYLPNDPKGYPIVYVSGIDFFCDFGDNVEPCFTFDGCYKGYTYLGQIIYPHPVNIVDARNCGNCGRKIKSPENCHPCIASEQNIMWQPKEESCK